MIKTIRIFKRSGQEFPFDISKIADAIRKASQAVDYKNALSEGHINLIVQEIVDDKVAACKSAGQRPSRSPRENRLRNSVAAIVQHNRRIRDAVIKAIPFYLGDITAAEIPREQQLDEVLNPKINGASKFLSEFGEAVKAYRPGEYPKDVIILLKMSTMHLIRNCLEPIHRDKTLNVSATVVSDFFDYLLRRDDKVTPEEHCKTIDEHIQRMQRRFCQNSDAAYELTSRIVKEREDINRRRDWKRKILIRKETQTIGEVSIDEFWSRFNKEKNKAKIGAPSADDHAENHYTQAEIAEMFGPPCTAEIVANWESKARGAKRGSIPPAAEYDGCLESYREELRKFPIGKNVDILRVIIDQYKATEGVKSATKKTKTIHCRSEEALYRAKNKHGV